MRVRPFVATFFVAVVGLPLAACHDDDHDHTSSYPACDAIIKACHTVDTGPGAIHDCHDLAHNAKSEAECTPKKDTCVALCTAAADAGSADATSVTSDAATGG